MAIGNNTRISRHARLDKTNPKGIHIGSHSSITFGVVILTHDFINRRHVDTFIGDYTFVGGNSIILPGVRVGNHCVIGAGSVVMNDIPDNSIAAGNPARIIRGGVNTTEYGILMPGSLADGPQSESVVGVSKSPIDVLAFVANELSIVHYSELNRPLESCGVDSFELIALRTAIEGLLSVTIPDREWAGLSCLADIAILPSLIKVQNSADVDEGTNPKPKPAEKAVVGEESADWVRDGEANLNYIVNMPQMALSGLSEAWLFKELGDIHWRLITSFLGKQSSAIQDATGDRLYATFTRIRLHANPSLRAFRENTALRAKSRLRRHGASMFFSDHKILGANCFVEATLMSTFAKYGERGKNTSLIKGTPEIARPDAIPVETQLPKFGAEYRDRRELSLEEIIYETYYEIIPSHDINGVGLLYFAAYPTIFDIGLEKFEGKGFITTHSTVSKDICYFANSDPTETLIFRVHSRDETNGIIRHALSLSRKSDGKRMADVISEKRLIQAGD